MARFMAAVKIKIQSAEVKVLKPILTQSHFRYAVASISLFPAECVA